MKGLAVNIFLEWGDREVTGECKMIAATTKTTLQEQLARLSVQLTTKLVEVGGPGGVNVGLYIEIFDVPPPLHSMYEFHHNMCGEGKTLKIVWSEIVSRRSLARGGDHNGKAS